MSETVIQIDRLSKEYRLGQIGGKRLVDDVSRWWARVRGKEDPLSKADMGEQANGHGGRFGTLQALENLSFEVKQSEVLGIIGRNGAGKSTLLKILSRVTAPSSGEVRVKGRIASLLEVGTGFHPELTGRENLFLNGAILGMSKSEIRSKLDEIVDFSGVEKFIDTPVKRYSSGMTVRLAFAVAAHLEPEILILDEVLAVGDSQFQKKCIGKMSDVAHEGRTVLFVSHNMTAIQSLCKRVIWLDQGREVAEGRPDRVVADYLKTSFSTLNNRVWDDPKTAPGNEKVRVRRATVRPTQGSHLDAINVRTPFVIEFEYWNLVPDAELNLSLVLSNDEGGTLFNTGPMTEPKWHGKPFPKGLFRSVCYVPGDFMNDGTVRVQLYVIEDQSVAIFRQDDILVFEVLEAPELRTSWYGKWPGAVRPMLDWSTDLITSDRSTERELVQV